MQKELHRCKSSGIHRDRELTLTLDMDRALEYMESTTQPLHLSNESCLVDSNNTAAEVKKQHYHSVTNSTTTQSLTNNSTTLLQKSRNNTYNPYQNSC